MKKLRRKIYVTAGHNTVSFGSGRKEFHPKKPMPTFETYLKEAADATRGQLPTPAFDEGVISNFMAARFIRQGNLAGFLPEICPELLRKPCVRVEGACGSGGLAIATGARSLLAETADSVFVVGFEVQNTMKAVYGADVLAGAGYYSGERKDGHAFFFPSKFAERAGAYMEKYGAEEARRAMARWYELAILNARLDPKAQEHHNATGDLLACGMTRPNAATFMENLNVYDCSKVSDGASSVALLSEEGLARTGVKKSDCVELVAFGQAEGNITRPPADPAALETTAAAAAAALGSAGITAADLGLLELHDCFTITGILGLEAVGAAPAGKGAKFVLDGHTERGGKLPTNLSGGLVGFGHYTGGTGIRQLVDLWRQFTGRAGASQAAPKSPFGLLVSMGGNDMTVTAAVVRKCE